MTSSSIAGGQSSIGVQRLGADWAVAALFLAIAYLDFSGTFREWGLASLGGDMTMILTRALAGLDPELFAGDFLFDQPQNYRFYNNFNVIYLQALQLLGLPLELGLRVLKGAATFAYLLGYYLLGRRVLGLPLAALAFALACTVTIPVVSGDYWGLYDEPQPRLLFAAALPYLLLLALSAEMRLSGWLVAMLFAGFAFWLHPASGPPVALAVMSGMFFKVWPGQPLLRVLGLALISGVAFLLLIAPNLGLYLADMRAAREGADPVLTDTVRALRFSTDFTNLPSGTWSGIWAIFAGPRILLLVLALASVAAMGRSRAITTMRDIRMLTGVVVSLLAIVVVVPVVVHELSRMRGEVSAEIDLVRSVRYLVPLLLLLVFAGALHLFKGRGRQLVASGAVALVWYVAHFFPPTYAQDISALRGLGCLVNGQPICAHRDSGDMMALVDFIKADTPSSATLFSPTLGPTIRSLTHRPLAFDWKDVGWLAYSNHGRAGENVPASELFVSTRAAAARGVSEWLSFARFVGADYLILAGAKDVKQGTETRVVFQNSAGTVVKVQPISDGRGLGDDL